MACLALIALMFNLSGFVEGSDIKWTLKKTPITFGKTAYLSCEIRQHDSCKKVRQWLGSSTYQPLCQNSDCIDTSKYDTMIHVSRHPSICFYTLTIHNFSESDVNCDYTCSYGTRFERKPLVLSSEDFEYIPSQSEIEVTLDSHMNNNVIVAFISKVFPTPSCVNTQWNAGVNKTQEIDVENTRNGLLYTTKLFVNYSLSACDDFSILCFIRDSHKVNIFNQSAQCNDKASIPATLLALVLAITAVLIGMCAFVGFVLWDRRSKRCQSRRDQNEEGMADYTQLFQVQTNKKEENTTLEDQQAYEIEDNSRHLPSADNRV